MNVFSFALSKIASAPKSGIGVWIYLRNPLIPCHFLLMTAYYSGKRMLQSATILRKLLIAFPHCRDNSLTFIIPL